LTPSFLDRRAEPSYGVGEQTVLDLGDIDVAKVIYKVSPGIVNPPDPGNKCDNTADCETIR
jgi:hypothetical protein